MYTTTVTPRFGDSDGLKHINNIALAEWFELARNPIYRLFTPDLDLSYKKWKLIMVKTEFEFLKQMYYRSDVEIRSFIIKIGNSSFTTYHEAWQEGELRAKGQAVIVRYDFMERKTRPIPQEIREILEEHLVSVEDLAHNR
jgi:acyl-CoA thioester hydrolase